jgi:hypothetical protein
MFGADGARPDLIEKDAGQGVMPTLSDLMSKG